MAVDLARKNLFHDRLRFFITIMGVAFAVTLVFVQVGLFLGLLSNASDTIDHLPADLWITSKNVPNVDFAKTFSEQYVQRVRSIPGVARADNLIVWFDTVTLPSGAEETVVVYGLEDFAAWSFPWRVAEGDPRRLRQGDYLFLDDSATRRFGPFRVGDYREVLGHRLRIIGRTLDARSFTTTPIAFLDYRLAQRISPERLGGNTSYVIVRLAPGADRAVVMAEIRRRLPYNDVFTADGWARQSRGYWVESTGIGLNAYLTIFLGCLVGVVVVAQTLYTATMEHLKEFGVVKAIGGGNATIYAILARQSAISAVVGFAVGGGMAAGLAPLLARVDLHMVVPPGVIAIVFVGTLALCLAASMVSFRKVASLDPALVFRG